MTVKESWSFGPEGEWVTSCTVEDLAARTGLTVKETREAIKELERDGIIAARKREV